ncbi:MAG: DUF2971 domain-containing protein [Cognatishimia sp.]
MSSKTLYRFRPLGSFGEKAHDREVFQHRLDECKEGLSERIFVSPLLEQNDIFEFAPYISSSNDDALLALRDKICATSKEDEVIRSLKQAPLAEIRGFIREGLEIMKETTKIACLSEAEKNPLMWGHYAGSHSGICMQYSLSEFLPDETRVVALPMMYQQKRPGLKEINALRFITFGRWREAAMPEDENLAMTAFRKISRFKSADWKYEREWRIAKPFASSDEKYALVPGLKLEAIIFGTKTLGSDREAFIQNAPKSLKFKEAVAHESKFEMQIRNIN